MIRNQAVGVDAHIDPAERSNYTVIFGEFVTFLRGDVGIAPYTNLEDFRNPVRRTTKAGYGRSFCQSFLKRRKVTRRSSAYRTARRLPPKMRLAMLKRTPAPAAT